MPAIRAAQAGELFHTGQYTRTHHLQSSDDLLLVANGANIVAMQSYSDQARLFREHLSDSITRRKTSAAACRYMTSPPGE